MKKYFDILRMSCFIPALPSFIIFLKSLMLLMEIFLLFEIEKQLLLQLCEGKHISQQ